MSNLWKLAGLACSRKDFIVEARALAESIGKRSFNNDQYQKALVKIDPFLSKWYSPLNHLDVQLFYDILCCKTIWDNFEKVLALGGLNVQADPADPVASIFWQVLGAAAFDPWRNTDKNGHPVVGFRQKLQQNISFVDGSGFNLSSQYRPMLTAFLKKPGMLDALQDVAMCYDEISESMLLNREVFPRMQEVQLPPGWMDLTKP
jgi:hypothetical protein